MSFMPIKHIQTSASVITITSIRFYFSKPNSVMCMQHKQVLDMPHETHAFHILVGYIDCQYQSRRHVRALKVGQAQAPYGTFLLHSSVALPAMLANMGGLRRCNMTSSRRCILLASSTALSAFPEWVNCHSVISASVVQHTVMCSMSGLHSISITPNAAHR